MLLFNLILFAISCAILYWVLRYRVHLHVSYEPRKARKFAGRRAGGANQPRSSSAAVLRDGRRNPQVEEIRSALVNLGAPKARAREVAERVCQMPGATFEVRMRQAIQEAQAA